MYGIGDLIGGGDLAAGGFPCWQIADRVGGRAASPLAARCAHAVLADHNLNITYYILHYIALPPKAPAGGAHRAGDRLRVPPGGAPAPLGAFSGNGGTGPGPGGRPGGG
jgi:hypothetical protein